MSYSNGPMITEFPPATPLAEIPDIGEGDTLVEGTDFTSKVLKVYDIWSMVLQLYATGANAGSAGDVDFVVLASVDGVNFSTEPYLTISVTLAGATKVAAAHQIDVMGVAAIKIGSILNNDATYHALLVGVLWGKTYAY